MHPMVDRMAHRRETPDLQGPRRRCRFEAPTSGTVARRTDCRSLGPQSRVGHRAVSTDIHQPEASGCYFRQVARNQPIQLGSQIAGYQLEREIGRGGVGVVYRAKDLRIGRTVALKVLAPQFALDDTFRRRFIHESRMAAAIDHPHIVPIFGAGEANGVLYIAMRYVSGPDLGALLDRDGPLPVSSALRITTQVASALDAAHEHGLVHRDVKPGNILLARNDVADDPYYAYLMDFGMAKPSLEEASSTTGGSSSAPWNTWPLSRSPAGL